MTMLICAGTLYSNFQRVMDKHLVTDPNHKVYLESLTLLNRRICQEHHFDIDELYWKPFEPGQDEVDDAKRLHSSVENTTPHTWVNTDACLLLDFWLRTAEDTKFLLFFASPEDELANFILNNGYCIDGYKNALGAWAIRTRAMQVFYMSNRDRCLLLNTKSANRNPERFVRLSSEILDIKLARPGVITQLMEQDHYYLQFLTATLLVGEDVISELYDEVRSAATVLDDNDLSMKDAKSRSEDLIPLSLKALQQNNLEAAEKMALAEELEATKLHIVQIQQELEFFYLKERNTCDINRKYASYLAQDPLLRLTRVLRTNDIPG